MATNFHLSAWGCCQGEKEMVIGSIVFVVLLWGIMGFLAGGLSYLLLGIPLSWMFGIDPFMAIAIRGLGAGILLGTWLYFLGVTGGEPQKTANGGKDRAAAGAAILVGILSGLYFFICGGGGGCPLLASLM